MVPLRSVQITYPAQACPKALTWLVLILKAHKGIFIIGVDAVRQQLGVGIKFLRNVPDNLLRGRAYVF
jgi:hypothetical protein